MLFQERIRTMVMMGYLVRDQKVIWRDIAGEVVIIGEDDNTIRMLNRTASFIWGLADGSRQLEEIAAELCERFQVAPEQAQVDAEEFCSELIEAGLASLVDLPREA